MKKSGSSTRGTVPKWAIRLCVKLLAWCQDVTIRFREPEKTDPPGSWQVTVVCPSYGAYKEQFEAMTVILRNFEWCISWDKHGISLIIWPKDSGKKKA